MSSPRYPKYKPSGVEWLGDVPEGWGYASLNRISNRVVVGIAEAATHAYATEGIPILRATNVRAGKIIGEILFIDPTFAADRGSKRLYAGDLVTVRTGNAGVTAVVPAEFDGCQCFTMLITSLNDGESVEFYCYWMNSISAQCYFSLEGWGTAQVNISVPILKTLPVPVPPHSEQLAIVDFLNRETGKIDELVAEQRRLMELLKEKRQAVISHAVTKGLNPHAPMKSSGIEWLGDVPEGWNVTVIKRFSTLQRGHDLTDAQRTEGAYPVVTSGGVSGTHGAFMARGPGVVTGRYGSTGRLFYIDDDYWPHNTALYVSDFHGNSPRFVWYSLQTVDFAAHSAKAAVPGIDRNDIHVLPVVVPPRDEQTAIVEFLETELAKFDTLTAEAQRAIDLLQERRTALISATVTGQIDVRQLPKN